MPSIIPIARASYADTLRKKTNTLTRETTCRFPAPVQAKAASGVNPVDAFPELIAPSKMGHSDPNKASVGNLKLILRRASYASVLKGGTAVDQKQSAHALANYTIPIEVKENEEKPQEMRPFVIVAKKPAPATKLPKKKNVIHRAFDLIATSVLPGKIDKVDVCKSINQSKPSQRTKNVPIPVLAELQNKSNWKDKGSVRGAAEHIDNTSDVIRIVAPKDTLKAQTKSKAIQEGKPVPLKDLGTILLPPAENTVRRRGKGHKRQHLIPVPVQVITASRIPKRDDCQKKIQSDSTIINTVTSEGLDVREVEGPEFKEDFEKRVKLVAADLRRRAVAVSHALSKPYGEDDISWIPAPATPKASPKSLQNQDSIYPIFAAISHIMPTPLAQKDKESRNLYTTLDVSSVDPLDDPLILPSFDDCCDTNSDISVNSFQGDITPTRIRNYSPVPDRLSLIREAKVPLNLIPSSEGKSTHITSIHTSPKTISVTTPLLKPNVVTYNFTSEDFDKTPTTVSDVRGTVLPKVQSHESSSRLCLNKEGRQGVEKVSPDSLPRVPSPLKPPRNCNQSPERTDMDIISALVHQSKSLEEDLDRLLDSFRPPSPEPWDLMEQLKKSGFAKKVTPTKTNKDPYERAAELLASEKKSVSNVRSKTAGGMKNAVDLEKKKQAEPTIKLLKYDSQPVVPQSMPQIVPTTASNVTSPKAFPLFSEGPPPAAPTSFPTSTARTTRDLINTTTTSIRYEIPTSATQLQHEHLEKRLLGARSHHTTISLGPPVTPRKHLPKSQLPVKRFYPRKQSKGMNNELTINNTAIKQGLKGNHTKELPLTKNHRAPIHPATSELVRNRRAYNPRARREEGFNNRQHRISDDVHDNDQVASIQAWTGIVARETSEAACLNGLSPVRKTLDEWKFMDRLFESKIAEIPRKRLDFNPKSHLLTPISPGAPLEKQHKDKVEGKEEGNCDGDDATICSVDSLNLTESGFYLDRCVGKKGEYLDIDIVYSDTSLDHNTFRQTLELQLLLELIIERSGYDDFELILLEFGDSNLLPLTIKEDCTNADLWSDIVILLSEEGFDIEWISIIDGRVKLLLYDYETARKKQELSLAERIEMIGKEKEESAPGLWRRPQVKPPPRLYRRPNGWH